MSSPTRGAHPPPCVAAPLVKGFVFGPLRRSGLRPRSCPAALSMALDTSSDLGNPLFPVAKISPLRRAMNAPCGTVMHHTTPA